MTKRRSTTIHISKPEFVQLREYIETHCGIVLRDDAEYLVKSRLGRLVAEVGASSYGEFLRMVRDDATRELRDRIVDAMTTNETLWFRDGKPYRVLGEALLPELGRLVASSERKTIRIWSAACSTGQEPYSIAMTVLETARLRGGPDPARVEIVGTDISRSALDVAQRGEYEGLAVARGLDGDIRRRYFRDEGKAVVLDEKVRRMVTFRRRNLQDSFSDLGEQDIVFCRNVLIYFSEDLKKSILARVAQLLRPRSGVLFLGSSESMFAYSEEFESLRMTQGTCYRVI